MLKAFNRLRRYEMFFVQPSRVNIPDNLTPCQGHGSQCGTWPERLAHPVDEEKKKGQIQKEAIGRYIAGQQRHSTFEPRQSANRKSEGESEQGEGAFSEG